MSEVVIDQVTQGVLELLAPAMPLLVKAVEGGAMIKIDMEAVLEPSESIGGWATNRDTGRRRITINIDYNAKPPEELK